MPRPKPSLHNVVPSVKLPPESAQVAPLANVLLAVYAFQNLGGLVQAPLALPDYGAVAALESVYVGFAAWHDGRFFGGAVGSFCCGEGLVSVFSAFGKKGDRCSRRAYLTVDRGV